MSSSQVVLHHSPSSLIARLSWEKNLSGEDFDLDLSALLLNEVGKLADSSHFIFYNNPKSPGGEVFLSEEETTSGKQIVKSLFLDLSKAGYAVSEILLIVTSHSKENPMGKGAQAQVSVNEGSSGKCLLLFDLNGDFRNASGLQLLALRRIADSWDLVSIGIPFDGGLAAILESVS